MLHEHDAAVDVDDGDATDCLTPLLDIFILSRNGIAILVSTRTFGIDDILEAGKRGKRFVESVMITTAAFKLFGELDAGRFVWDGYL